MTLRFKFKEWLKKILCSHSDIPSDWIPFDGHWSYTEKCSFCNRVKKFKGFKKTRVDQQLDYGEDS